MVSFRDLLIVLTRALEWCLELIRMADMETICTRRILLTIYKKT